MSFPSLLSLDVGYNFLVDLRLCISSLQALKELKMLNIKGNPLSLIRGYTVAIKAELQTLEHLDGVLIPKSSDVVSDKVIHDIQTLQEQQYAERRLKLQQEQEAKNKKPVKEAPKPKEAPKKEIKDVKVDVKMDPIEQLELRSEDTMNEGMFIPEGLTHPIRLQVSVKTLENFESVFFEELADNIDSRSPAADKDRVMASYWIELAFSSFS